MGGASWDVPVGPTDRGPLGGRVVEVEGNGEAVAEGTVEDVGKRARLLGDGVVDIFACSCTPLKR